MRKQIIDQEIDKSNTTDEKWLDLEEKAQVELSSEDPDFPFEEALAEGGKGWRASQTGKQVIRILFTEPQKIRRILLVFEENQQERTQEFLLSCSSDKNSYKEIVRQQYNFSPSQTNKEIEDYTVNLDDVSVIELSINPDISRDNIPASLALIKIA